MYWTPERVWQYDIMRGHIEQSPHVSVALASVNEEDFRAEMAFHNIPLVDTPYFLAGMKPDRGGDPVYFVYVPVEEWNRGKHVGFRKSATFGARLCLPSNQAVLSVGNCVI